MARQVHLLHPGHDPGSPEDLLVPIARIVHVPRGFSLSDVADLPARLGGRAKKPKAPVGLVDPSGMPIFLVGMGETEAAELQEMAYDVIERRSKRPWQGIDRDHPKYRHRLVPYKNFSDAFKEALQERIKRHKANPVTDPPGPSSDLPRRNF